MNKILYGTAYYYEYLPYDRLDDDIKMMREANINVVRIGESTWSTYEKEDGVFDFSSLDLVLDKMYQAGISVIVGTPTYAIPSWLALKYPEVMVQNDGVRQPYGARQIFDITNPAFLYYAERIIRNMVEHVKNHPAIIGYQVDNETKHYGTSSDNVQKKFVTYVKKEFNEDITYLNKEFGLDYWSNRIDSWENFPSMDGTINGSLKAEFEKFRHQIVTDYLEWQVKIVKEYATETQFVTHNFDFEWRGQSYGIQPEVNHFDASEPLDIVGGDIYHPSQSLLTGAEVSFGGDVLRSLKNNNYFIMETQAQAFKQQVPYPGQLRLLAYSHIASGANMVEYWHWHSIHNSFETYWKGILSHDFKPNPIYKEVVRTGKELTNLSDKLVNLKAKAEVAFLVSNQSFSALNEFPFSETKNYNDIFRLLYDQFYYLNIRTDILDETHINLDKYKLIVVPPLYSVSDDFLHKLNKFVADGGHVMYMFKSGFTDEHVKVRTEVQPGIISDACGIHYDLFVDPEDCELVPSGDAITSKERHLTDWMELLVPDTAEVLASYSNPNWSGYAAVTLNNYGEGSAMYIGCLPSKSIIKDLIMYYINKIGLEISDSTFPIVVKSATNEKGNNIVFYLNYSEKTQNFSINSGGVDLVTNDKVDTNLSLEPWGVAIIEN